MSWATIAGKGIALAPLKQVFKIPVSWHCNLQFENKDLIEDYANDIAKEHGYKKCFVRAGVHNTKTVSGPCGTKRILQNQPWHFTLEFETLVGKFQNMHVYTDTQRLYNDQGVRQMVTKGILAPCEEIPQTPEIFVDQGHSSHKKHLLNNVTSASITSVSRGLVMKFR